MSVMEWPHAHAMRRFGKKFFDESTCSVSLLGEIAVKPRYPNSIH